MSKVQKFLWVDTRSGEIIMRSVGLGRDKKGNPIPPAKFLGLQSREDMEKRADPQFKKLLDEGIVQPIEGIFAWCDASDPLDALQMRGASNA